MKKIPFTKEQYYAQLDAKLTPQTPMRTGRTVVDQLLQANPMNTTQPYKISNTSRN